MTHLKKINWKTYLFHPIDALGVRIYIRPKSQSVLSKIFVRTLIIPTTLYDVCQVPVHGIKTLKLGSRYCIRVLTFNQFCKTAKFGNLTATALKTAAFTGVVVCLPVTAIGTIFTPKMLLWLHSPFLKPELISDARKMRNLLLDDLKMIEEEEKKILFPEEEWKASVLTEKYAKLSEKLDVKIRKYKKEYGWLLPPQCRLKEAPKLNQLLEELVIWKKKFSKFSAIEKSLSGYLENQVSYMEKSLNDDTITLGKKIGQCDIALMFIEQNKASLEQNTHKTADLKAKFESTKALLEHYRKVLKVFADYQAGLLKIQESFKEENKGSLMDIHKSIQFIQTALKFLKHSEKQLGDKGKEVKTQLEQARETGLSFLKGPKDEWEKKINQIHLSVSGNKVHTVETLETYQKLILEAIKFFSEYKICYPEVKLEDIVDLSVEINELLELNAHNYSKKKKV